MKLSLFAQIVSAIARQGAGLCAIAFTISSTATLTQPSYAQNQKFFCAISRDVPVTSVRTSSGPIPIIRWVDTAFPRPWTPEQRCEEISARFERFYNNGTLNFLRAGTYNRQMVLCVAGEKDGPCLPDGVLVTFQPGTNPRKTLERLQDFQGPNRGRAVYLSNNAAYLDINKFIAQAEGSVTPASCPVGRPAAAWEC
jgi:hypothetical protein